MLKEFLFSVDCSYILFPNINFHYGPSSIVRCGVVWASGRSWQRCGNMAWYAPSLAIRQQFIQRCADTQKNMVERRLVEVWLYINFFLILIAGTTICQSCAGNIAGSQDSQNNYDANRWSAISSVRIMTCGGLHSIFWLIGDSGHVNS